MFWKQGTMGMGCFFRQISFWQGDGLKTCVVLVTNWRVSTIAISTVATNDRIGDEWVCGMIREMPDTINQVGDASQHRSASCVDVQVLFEMSTRREEHVMMVTWRDDAHPTHLKKKELQLTNWQDFKMVLFIGFIRDRDWEGE